MTRAHVWQTSSWLRWLLPAASPWRETAVGKPSSRSDQLSVQGEEVWSPQGQQPFPGGSLYQQESGGLGSSGCIGCRAHICGLHLPSQQLTLGM